MRTGTCFITTDFHFEKYNYDTCLREDSGKNNFFSLGIVTPRCFGMRSPPHSTMRISWRPIQRTASHRFTHWVRPTAGK